MGLILGVIIALIFIVGTTVVEAIRFMAARTEDTKDGEKQPTVAAKVVTGIFLASLIITIIVGIALSVS